MLLKDKEEEAFPLLHIYNLYSPSFLVIMFQLIYSFFRHFKYKKLHFFTS